MKRPIKTSALGKVWALADAQPKTVGALKRKPTRLPNVADAPFGIQQAVLQRAVGENGIGGVFMHSLRKLVFYYCEHGGSSSGMRTFITSKLVQFARQHPQFEVVVQPRLYRHPDIYAYYDNGMRKKLSARNMEPLQIDRFVERFRDTIGLDPLKLKRPVVHTSDSVRGVWSPFKSVQVRPDRQPLAPRFLFTNNI